MKCLLKSSFFDALLESIAVNKTEIMLSFAEARVGGLGRCSKILEIFLSFPKAAW